MCFAQGSLDQATKPCPMCQVFKPSVVRCPHIKDICRNNSVHPRYDVVYLKNAEVQTFNGCGYCKWLKVAPPYKQSSSQNTGWPGCCRMPTSSEHRYIPPADWPAVSIVHHIPIPPEVKNVLDSISAPPPRANSSSPQSISPSASLGRSAGLQAAGSPPSVRRTGANVVTKPDITSWKTSASITPTGRAGNSPPQTTSPLTRSSRIPTEPNLPGSGDLGDKTGDLSPGKKPADLDAWPAHRSSGRQPSLSSVAIPPSSAKANLDHSSDRDKRRTSNAINVNASSIQRSSPPGRSQVKNGGLETSMAGLSLATSTNGASGSAKQNVIRGGGSSAASSGSSEQTVDGGFTDYLSDESEAELQRQAEIKAALVAQNRMEEQEFRAARQQLASVDLRPPKTWNPDNSSTPRSQVGSQPTHGHNPYVPASAAFSYSARA